MSNNLELLREFQSGMNLEQQREFEDYLVGALSFLVAEKEWKEALESARRCYASNATRRDAERAGGAA